VQIEKKKHRGKGERPEKKRIQRGGGNDLSGSPQAVGALGGGIKKGTSPSDAAEWSRSAGLRTAPAGARPRAMRVK